MSVKSFSCFRSFSGARVHGARIEQSICLIAIQHKERPGCGNTASGSAGDRWARPRICHPHLLSCVHQSLQGSHHTQQGGRVPNSHLRTPGSYEKVGGIASKPHWNWHELSLPGSSPPRRARIASTPATVRPAHGAAIVEAVRGESGGSCRPP